MTFEQYKPISIIKTLEEEQEKNSPIYKLGVDLKEHKDRLSRSQKEREGGI